MLFLDTCIVKAEGVYNALNFEQDFASAKVYCNGMSSAGSSGGYISNGTGSIQSIQTHYRNGGTYHIKGGFEITGNWSNTYDGNRLYKVMYQISNFSVSSGTPSNLIFYRADGSMLSNSNPTTYLAYDSELVTFVDGQNMGYHNLGYFEFDLTFPNSTRVNDALDLYSFTVSFHVRNYLSTPTPQDIKSMEQKTFDESANQSLDNVKQSSQSTANNTSGILSKITDFFGSFFENLIGIFVPEDGYFSGWFDRVNTLLSQKLGMLYAPFDLVISTLQAIYSADSTETGIPFPGIKWEDTWLVEPFTFTFASLGDSFDDLRDKVYFATDTVLVLTFLMLLQSKVKLILEGHE